MARVDPTGLIDYLLERSRGAWLRASAPANWTDAKFDALIDVDPKAIVHYQDISEWRHPRLVRYSPESGSDARRFVRANRGKVLDDDWDLVRMPFEDNNVYRLLHEHFVLGVPWEKTEIFRKFAAEIAAGGRRWRASSVAGMLETAREAEDLFRSMRDEGYRCDGPADAITVSIGRSGQLLYNNVGGHHRLSIAKILAIDSIPVRVLLRHRSWQDVRDELRSQRRVEPNDGLADHPDLVSLFS